MIVESLLGTIVGGILRLLPEGLQFWKNKTDADHEYRLAQLNFESLKFQAEKSLDIKRLDSEMTLAAGELQALIEGNKSQTSMLAHTGIKWVDAVIVGANAMMRPYLVYFYASMYAAVKVAIYYTYLGDGLDWKQGMMLLWNTEDSAVWASICSYVFLDRTLRKKT